MKLLTSLFLIFSPLFLFAQQSDTATGELSDVTVKSFEQKHKYKELAASVGYINQDAFQKFNPTSAVAAMNIIPGVRMEERSPGSYRLNIRGSSLRSPFGVRNVKIYYNDLPFTDPGGQSYLNQLGAYHFNSAEIIKGPAGSVYGAGTGGVLLIDAFNTQDNAFAEYTYSSYKTHNIFGRFTIGTEDRSQFSFQHQQSDGYRSHSALRKEVFSYTGNYNLDERTIVRTSFLYGDLRYETPGALTQAEYDLNARSSRPGAGAFPSAVNAGAAIMQRMFIAGASITHHISKQISNKTVLYGMFTDLRNPAIQNYGHNSEPHTGIRSVFNFYFQKINFQTGIEAQQGFATIEVFKNLNGNADSLRTTDKVNNRNAFAFAQLNFENADWILTAAASTNNLRVNYQRFAPAAGTQQTIQFKNIAPRFSVLKKWKPFNLYASVAKGFSPPTTAEIFPSGNAVNIDLLAEEGLNYELGMKGNIMRNAFLSITGFHYNLKNAIAQRRTAGGGDYYINAGRTKQQGIETILQYSLAKNISFDRINFLFSHSYSKFRYTDFKQLTNDYSGNQLPSVPKHSIAFNIDLISEKKISAFITYYYSSRIPLNDANTVYASGYHLLGSKIQYRFGLKKNANVNLAAGVENILDQKYSLGNDINGFNGRYYNVAPGRNFFVQINFRRGRTAQR